MSEYKPGTCNINRTETRKRKFTGIAGLSATTILAAWYVTGGLPVYTLLFILGLATFGFQGLIQAKSNFCVAHGKKGTRKTSDEVEEVKDEESEQKDNEKANQILMKSITMGILTTILIQILNLASNAW